MTTHTMNGWKTDGIYGVFVRTRPDENGMGSGKEVKVGELNDKQKEKKQ